LDVRPIKTLAQLYEQLATLFHIKPITNEPILLRLQLVLQRTFVYVVLEHIDECEAGISANVIMTHIRAHLPMMRCIAISRMAGILGQQREYHEEVIPALDTAHIRASACQLFMQIYHQAGGQRIDATYVLESCQAVQGNPLSISMIANAVAHATDMTNTDDVVRNNINQLDRIDKQIVTLLSMSASPMTRRFLALIAPHTWELNATGLLGRLTRLTQRRIVYVVGSDAQMRVGVNVVIRQVVIHHLSSDETHALLRRIASAIHQLDLRWEVVTGTHGVLSETNDLWCVLGCATLMLTHNMYPETAQLLIVGRTMWVRHGLSDGAIPLVESCISALDDAHPVLPELLFTLGSLYGARGMIPLALTYLRRAYAEALYRQQLPLVCQIAAEIGMNGVIDTSTPPIITYDTICAYLDAAVTFLQSHDDLVLRASVLDLYAYVCLSAGDSQRAIALNDVALSLYTQCESVHGMIEAQFNRGLIYMACGEFDVAQPALAYAKAEYARLQIDIGQAQCNLRLAAIAVLSGDAQHTRTLLAAAIDPLQRGGGLQDMLYIMDIYSGVLLLQGAFHETLLLCERVEHFRSERHIFRGKQLEAIFQQQLQRASQHVDAVALDRTHVIRLIRDDLLAV
jgi:tetratricopeptide (TPR) repeat protein